MKIKQEIPTNAEAFEYYFAMGDNRSYEKTAEHFKVTKTTVQNWAESFNWQARVEIRNIEINKEIERRSKKENIATRAKMVADIDAALAMTRTLLNENLKTINDKIEKMRNKQAEGDDSPNEPIFDRVKSTKQFLELFRAIDCIMMLRRKITGEATETELLSDENDVVKIYIPQRRKSEENE
jgi:hypothetical protein